MKSLLLLSLLVISAIASLKSEHEALRQFVAFQHKYNKSYKDDTEFKSRFETFKLNLQRAAEYQARETGTATYGVTKFSDLTEEEFRSFYLMPKFSAKDMPSRPLVNVVTKDVDSTDSSFDWNNKGAITPVKNQGQCGSCWAFSATETIESYWFLAGNTLTALSPEQIVDCDTSGEDQGCDGGWPYGAYAYVMSAGGLDSESAYPYTAEGGNSGNCNFSTAAIVAKISNWQYVTQSQDENAMFSWINSNGPLSICVDASSWSSYTGGVVQSCTDSLDHCVQMTGYDNVQGINAWNVRNSWGTDWGNNGYIWLARGNDTCGCAEVVTAVSI